MSGRNEQEYLFQEAARRELAQGRIDRREFLTRSLVTGLGLAGVGTVAKSGIRPAFAADRPLTPTFYQWIQDLHPGIPAVNAKFPGINYQIAPVEGFGIERFVAEAKNKRKHLGRLCRPDAVRRNVGDDQGRRHRAVGQLHPEGRDRRHHSVDPRGMHDRRQALWLAVPSRRDRHGLALGPHDQGRRCRTPRPRPGTSSWPTPRRSSIRRPRPAARPSTRMAGARWRRSRTA